MRMPRTRLSPMFVLCLTWCACVRVLLLLVRPQIRERESGIDMEIDPILDMYTMLERYLPENFINKEEMDQKDVLKVSWRKLIECAESVTDEIARLQGGFKKKLLSDVKVFVADVVAFRNDYLANGPMVKGIAPQDAMERLRRYQDEFELRYRRYVWLHRVWLCCGGRCVCVCVCVWTVCGLCVCVDCAVVFAGLLPINVSLSAAHDHVACCTTPHPTCPLQVRAVQWWRAAVCAQEDGVP
jgi:hypothetical protein